MQTQELAIPVETRPNNTQLAFDTEASTVAISITLETLMTIAGGSAVIAAKPYLA
jgi:ribosomal protein S27E